MYFQTAQQQQQAQFLVPAAFHQQGVQFVPTTQQQQFIPISLQSQALHQQPVYAQQQQQVTMFAPQSNYNNNAATSNINNSAKLIEQLIIQQKINHYITSASAAAPRTQAQQQYHQKRVASNSINKNNNSNNVAAAASPITHPPNTLFAPTQSTNRSHIAGVDVIDPALCIGKITIPRNKIFNTLGLHYWDVGNCRRDLSVCCLFQQRRCHAGERCHQIHVDHEYISEIRKKNLVVECCPHCSKNEQQKESDGENNNSQNNNNNNNNNNKNMNWLDGKIPQLQINHEGKTIPVAKDRLVYTTGAAEHIRQVTTSSSSATTDDVNTTLPITSICKLFLQKKCRYSRDCKYFHVCPQFMESVTKNNNDGKNADENSTSSSSLVLLPTTCQIIAANAAANEAAQAQAKSEDGDLLFDDDIAVVVVVLLR